MVFQDDSHRPQHHDPVPGAIPVPHGPTDYYTVDGQFVNEDDTYPRFADKDEKAIFAYLLHPRDSYDENGTYWADMPLKQRIAFNASVEGNEVCREFKAFWAMFKADPLAPVGWYFRNAVLPGAGLLLEGYVLFSVGNIKSLFSNVWPECWTDYKVCNKEWVAAVNYLEIVGIMFGQVGIGLIADMLGNRKVGLVIDAMNMFIGLLMLTAMWGVTLNGWVICYAWSLFFYSIGVGGEYPMTAATGMEKSKFNRVSAADDRLHRGRKVTMAFLMQGWGQFLNQAILIILLLIFHHGSAKPDLVNGKYKYSKVATQWVFRVSFAIPAIGTLWLAYFRHYKIPSIKPAVRADGTKNVSGYNSQSLKLLFTHFGGRMLATCGAWFCNDVFFYGNKLFQGQFISVITGGSKSSGVIVDWNYNLINIGCSMFGYYLASFTIDSRFWGRNRMQQLGFLMCFVLFVVPAFHYKYYTSKEHIHEFQAMYFLSSFFNQFGPNAVTFLVAAEVLPTQVRATGHGVAAAWGKAGALLASVLYNYIDTQTKFYVVPWFGLAGMVLTLVFLPDVTGLDLASLDRRWALIMEGRGDEYHGIAINPRHLSLWERFRGVGKNYNPELDYKQRVDEMRHEWEERERAKYNDEKAFDGRSSMHLSPDIHNYFLKTSPAMSAAKNEKPGDNFKLPEAESDISDPSVNQAPQKKQ